MVKVNLKLISEFLPSKEEEIEITLAEIIELAKEKIKNQYENDIYNTIIYKGFSFTDSLKEKEDIIFDDLDKEIIKRYLG